MAFHFRNFQKSIAFALAYVFVSLFLLKTFVPSNQKNPSLAYDVVIYDATAGGVTAAISASRKGLKTAIVCASWPSCFLEGGKRVGGMSANGLGQTDIGNTYPFVSGIAREFYERNWKYYAKGSKMNETSSDCRLPSKSCNVTWNLEPHVAQMIFQNMLEEEKVDVIFGFQVVSVQWNKLKKNYIESIKLVQQDTRKELYLYAQIFIDASYEGDLMAASNISYTLGREGKNVYNESLAGMSNTSWYHQFDVDVNPFNGTTGQPLKFSDLPDPSRKFGSGDKLIQSYNFRLCVTTESDNKIAFPKPKGYNPLDWELLKRYIVACLNNNTCYLGFPSCNIAKIPGTQKFDINNCGAFSTDCIGCSYEYPDASYEERRDIWMKHLDYQQGLLYFMANDPTVPLMVRRNTSRYGLCKDEFQNNSLSPNWPPGLYVREARRLVGDHVFTQNTPVIQRNEPGGGIGNLSIAIGGYNFDSHNTQRWACINSSSCYGIVPFNKTKDGDAFAWNEGDVEINPGLYQIPYWVMLPKKSEVNNLLVVAAPSASHIGMSTLRMEPQFMMIGHASGTAAYLAIINKVPVHNIRFNQLSAILHHEGMITQIPKINANIVTSSNMKL